MGEWRRWHKWAWRLAGSVLLALAVGCRVPPPNVRPPEPPQELTKPPDLAKYDKVEWPKVALDDPNPRDRSNKDSLLQQGSPANAGMGSMSPGGMSPTSGGGGQGYNR